MTCDEARERFSELLDERLGAADRVALDAHLGGCAACRHELDRFRATVALVRSLEPARAPAGFVDRVTAAARSRPWWRRVAAGAIFPLPVKLPMEAAAILLVGVGVVYLFQGTPELQRAARDETLLMAPPREAPAEAREDRADAPRTFADAPAPPATVEERRAVVQAPAAPQSPPAPTAPAPEPPAVAGSKAENIAGARPSADAVAPQRAREETRELARRDAPRLAAKSLRRADVTATLRVESRPAAEGAVRELVSRHRGAIDASRTEPDATVVEARIPREEWAAFAAGLAGVGRGAPAHEADLPAEVRVSIRLE